jgi:hypothetical protein
MRFLAIALFLVVGACSESWNQADELTGKLRCGLTTDQTEALANQFGAESGLYAHDEAGTRAVRRGNTEIVLWFEEGTLIAYQRRDFRPITTVITTPRMNACSGAQEVELTVEAPKEYRGGTVNIGTRRLAVNTPTTTVSLFLPLGSYTVSLAKENLPTLSEDVILDASSGTARLVLRAK